MALRGLVAAGAAGAMALLGAVGTVQAADTSGAGAQHSEARQASAASQPSAALHPGHGERAAHLHRYPLKVGVRDTKGKRIGVVWLLQLRDGVLVRATFHSLTPGFHGFHVHETGVCKVDNPATPFTSAGGHYAGRAGAVHGQHAGDLPPLLVTARGRASMSFVTDRFSVRELRDADGSAVIVHSGADNFANIPDRYQSTLSGTPGPDEETLKAGDAGTRVACGVIRPARS